MAVVAIQLALLETASFAFLKFYLFPRQQRFFFYDFDGFAARISDENLRRYAANNPRAVYWFDADLGWNTGPGIDGINDRGCHGASWHYSTDSLGSRNGSAGTGAPLVSLYGDSYTFGAEANDDETWQHYLSQMTGTPVYNFGVGGYGLDQALLKLERNYARARTPIVVLGVYSAGIPRNLNAFRPFLEPAAGLDLGFKPMLLPTGDGYAWRENPLKTLDRAAIERAQAIASTYDYYYRLNQEKPKLGFPYLTTLLQEAYYIPFVYERREELWHVDHPAYRVMREIVRRFVAFSHQEGFQPVLVFMPAIGELEGYDAGKSPYYARFFSEVRSSYPSSELQLVDVYREKFDAREFSPPGCHPTPYGNKVIAKAVHDQIGPAIRRLQAAASEVGS